jgi:6-phosphofructokinase 1
VIHHQIADRIKDYEVRYTNLSYIQRGGTASQFDREIGLRFGVHALDLMMSGQYGQMVRYKSGQVDSVDLEDVVGRGETGETSKGGAKFVDPTGQIVHTAKMIGISFGDE